MRELRLNSISLKKERIVWSLTSGNLNRKRPHPVVWCNSRAKMSLLTMVQMAAQAPEVTKRNLKAWKWFPWTILKRNNRQSKLIALIGESLCIRRRITCRSSKLEKASKKELQTPTRRGTSSGRNEIRLCLAKDRQEPQGWSRRSRIKRHRTIRGIISEILDSRQVGVEPSHKVNLFTESTNATQTKGIF